MNHTKHKIVIEYFLQKNEQVTKKLNDSIQNSIS